MLKKLVALLLAVVLVTMVSVPAFAAEFTDSVEAKPAPEIETQTGSDGKEYEAIIRDESGDEVVGVPFGNITVTPASQADEAPAAVKERLEDAYEQLKSVESLTDLSDSLETIIQEVIPDITVEDLVVRDLFDVSVSGEYADYLAVEGNTISIRFTLSASADSLAAVLHNVEGTTWETITNDRITRNSDNTVDVVFDSLSPIAFLFDAKELTVDPDGPSSPQTGDTGSYATVWVVVGCAIAAGIAYILIKKRSTQKV